MSLAFLLNFAVFCENDDISLKMLFPLNAEITYFPYKPRSDQKSPFWMAKTLCYSNISSFGRKLSYFHYFQENIKLSILAKMLQNLENERKCKINIKQHFSAQGWKCCCSTTFWPSKIVDFTNSCDFTFWWNPQFLMKFTNFHNFSQLLTIFNNL